MFCGLILFYIQTKYSSYYLNILKCFWIICSYDEAHIVASAYNISVDWSSALYFNCVVKGDLSYHRIWSKHHQLNQSVVQDVVRRFDFITIKYKFYS